MHVGIYIHTLVIELPPCILNGILRFSAVYRIGKAGLERHLKQSIDAAIKQMVFVEEQVRCGF